MCRWIAYIGKSIYMDVLVIRPVHSLVEQSMNAKMRVAQDGSILSINGDGFGIGWYSDNKKEPALFKVSDPAWSNENIHEICTHTKTQIFMSHIRAATNGGVQRSNTHPFKYKNWLFQHNGHTIGFEIIRRDLQFAISPALYPLVQGTTDSETFFFLALTYGLEKNPKEAIEKTLKRVKQACEDNNIPMQLNFSTAISDGKSLYTIRYAEGMHANSQYYSTNADCMQERNKGYEVQGEKPKGVIFVSEPLDMSEEYWTEMPKNSFSETKNGKVTINPLNLS